MLDSAQWFQEGNTIIALLSIVKVHRFRTVKLLTKREA